MLSATIYFSGRLEFLFVVINFHSKCCKYKEHFLFFICLSLELYKVIYWRLNYKQNTLIISYFWQLPLVIVFNCSPIPFHYLFSSSILCFNSCGGGDIVIVTEIAQSLEYVLVPRPVISFPPHCSLRCEHELVHKCQLQLVMWPSIAMLVSDPT